MTIQFADNNKPKAFQNLKNYAGRIEGTKAFGLATRGTSLQFYLPDFTREDFIQFCEHYNAKRGRGAEEEKGYRDQAAFLLMDHRVDDPLISFSIYDRWGSFRVGAFGDHRERLVQVFEDHGIKVDPAHN